MGTAGGAAGQAPQNWTGLTTTEVAWLEQAERLRHRANLDYLARELVAEDDRSLARRSADGLMPKYMKDPTLNPRLHLHQYIDIGNLRHRQPFNFHLFGF